MRITMAVVATSLLGLTGCDKIQSMIKGEAPADAAPPVAAPSVPSVEAAPSAPVAVTPSAPTATGKTVVAPKKDGGAADAGPADAGPAVVDAGPAPGPTKPVRGKFTCDPTGCACEAGAACEIKCPGASPCAVEIREIANATIFGAGGPLSVTCKKGANCKVVSASGASTTRCTEANCDVQCNVGNCSVSCTGGACKTQKKSTGTITCTGTGCPK